MQKRHHTEKILVIEDMEPEVLDTVRVECPKCGAQILEKATNKDNIVCFCCLRQISVKEFSTNDQPKPLYLPSGVIRYLLIIGFGLSAILALKNSLFDNSVYLEFFVILAGLIIGYFVAKMTSHLKYQDISFYNVITHLKGVLVLC
ncbi:MAG: hypothetical protein L3J71_02650 [Victivallaceae bacterium]|nr:hypothetical protein [Victivallaceae bacterium]